jgi:hypothetical protein
MKNLTPSTNNHFTPHSLSLELKNKIFWHSCEYLNSSDYYYATKIFANREIVNFEAGMTSLNPKKTAYAIRADYWEDFEEVWNQFLISNISSEVKAIVFSVFDCETQISDLIANSHKRLVKLKYVFFGDSNGTISISMQPQEDVTSLLLAYQKLEVLHVRMSNWLCYRTGEMMNDGLNFCQPLKHSKLKVLRIESGGLGRQVLIDLNQLDLPNLQYLELCLGDPQYGGNSSIGDLISIISGEKFPKLKYLGLRNCMYTDEIAFELSKIAIPYNLIELDLSMGTLADEGLLALLQSSNIDRIGVLNVSQNFISERFISKELPKLKISCQLIIGDQRCSKYTNSSDRYCVVSE